MRTIYQERASYSRDSGLMGFVNPSCNPADPVRCVSFCSVDTMFHVYMGQNPFINDASGKIAAERLESAVKSYNGAWPGCTRGSHYDRITGTSNRWLLVWGPGKIDLDDMVEIVNSVPELQTSTWLREKVGDLKVEAGIDRGDLPFLDHDRNPYNRYYDGTLKFIPRGLVRPCLCQRQGWDTIFA